MEKKGLLQKNTNIHLCHRVNQSTPISEAREQLNDSTQASFKFEWPVRQWERGYKTCSRGIAINQGTSLRKKVTHLNWCVSVGDNSWRLKKFNVEHNTMLYTLIQSWAIPIKKNLRHNLTSMEGLVPWSSTNFPGITWIYYVHAKLRHKTDQ